MVRIYTFSLPDRHPLNDVLNRTKNRSAYIRRMLKQGLMLHVYQAAGIEVTTNMNDLRTNEGLPPVGWSSFVNKHKYILLGEEE